MVTGRSDRASEAVLLPAEARALGALPSVYLSQLANQTLKVLLRKRGDELIDYVA